MNKIRLDLFVCLLVAGAILCGVGYLLFTFVPWDEVIDSVGEMVSNTQDVEDGEVGGYATDDIPRAESFEELAYFARNDEEFTIEAPVTKCYNYGTFVAEEHEWRILKLEDGCLIAILLNKDKVIEGDDYDDPDIFPVGRVVLEEPAALEDMLDMVGDDAGLVEDGYIDMDGEANYTYLGTGYKAAATLVVVISSLLPLLVFALWIFMTLKMHAVLFYKGIFSEIYTDRFFKKKEKKLD